MATGLVFGRVVRSSGRVAPEIRVILGWIHQLGLAGRHAPGLPVEPADRTVACPPYGVCDETNAEGRYVLVYKWPGYLYAEQADHLASCRFRVMCFDLSQLSPFAGSASREGGVVGLDLKSLISQLAPLDGFSGGTDSAKVWLNLIAESMNTVPKSSKMARGMLGEAVSTERYTVASRIDVRLRN